MSSPRPNIREQIKLAHALLEGFSAILDADESLSDSEESELLSSSENETAVDLESLHPNDLLRKVKDSYNKLPKDFLIHLLFPKQNEPLPELNDLKELVKLIDHFEEFRRVIDFNPSAGQFILGIDESQHAKLDKNFDQFLEKQFKFLNTQEQKVKHQQGHSSRMFTPKENEEQKSVDEHKHTSTRKPK